MKKTIGTITHLASAGLGFAVLSLLLAYDLFMTRVLGRDCPDLGGRNPFS